MSEITGTAWSGRHRAKDVLRSEIWSQLAQQGAALGEPVGHIPSFVGGDEAADRLAQLPFWQQAKIIKCNPDTAQVPVRLRALQDGKKLYMAVPRLVQEKCFVELTALDLQQRGLEPRAAATHQGAMKHGCLVAFEEMESIDVVVTGCVAVSRDGGRTGKGAGFADLELGILRQLGLVQPDTPIVTTVHPLQVVDSSHLPMLSHDWSLTWIITPNEVIETQLTRSQPTGLEWAKVRPEQLESIPVLRHLKE
ncbi:MAG: 5-formyltetrahydrofolate cyclo-ligase [Anaerolineae bacterium]|jgi:5-formyltetrahydrofolate cyclo-ligase|nr:5-formyltetrahydrofolate cyclo-ligase [Anaerolineae bacterium]